MPLSQRLLAVSSSPPLRCWYHPLTSADVAEKRNPPIHTNPNIKGIGTYAVDEVSKRNPPIHTNPYIKAIGTYAVDGPETKRNPPIHTNPNIKGVGTYAVDEES